MIALLLTIWLGGAAAMSLFLIAEQAIQEEPVRWRELGWTFAWPLALVLVAWDKVTGRW